MEFIQKYIPTILNGLKKIEKFISKSPVVYDDTTRIFGECLNKFPYIITSYTPGLFKIIRECSYVRNTFFQLINDNFYIIDGNSCGNLKSSIYFTNDYQFVIKIISMSEKQCLDEISSYYKNYLYKHQNSLLCRIIGSYLIEIEEKIHGDKNKKKKIYFIVMKNIFPRDKTIDMIFDLKGSSRQGSTHRETSIYKDDEWDSFKKPLIIYTRKFQLIKRLERDIKFLCGMKLMDYSLLIGIHFENCNYRTYRNMYGVRHVSPSIESQMMLLNRDEISNIEYFYNENINLYISDDIENSDYYYIGIIDILTKWTFRKKLERTFNTLLCRCRSSSTSPYKYADRLNFFIKEKLFYCERKKDQNKISHLKDEIIDK
ncbi:putative phosphatidylinositol phosphate kinase [Astathelohania contejeani]|uniref:Phosphatidylinositol phosphate kinase n=1 Tax=Astathelohania contejeani TaxID=164912 RepID=A0ABQ7I1T5_9MICR|nr:putative phosphatidylinositol phosphate kinase [Thelohania contejeani]